MQKAGTCRLSSPLVCANKVVKLESTGSVLPSGRFQVADRGLKGLFGGQIPQLPF